MKKTKLVSPKDFMRDRKPEKFSDSKTLKASKLDRTSLEIYFLSLTSRQQEYQFESFARKLCQLEICPGLKPITGPSGGGDGKVDSETIPKSKEIELLYSVGVEKNTNEKWAFAFSAKKKWTPKVTSDVKKIAETKRNYKKIFFVTNQYTRAGTRSKKEVELSKKYNVEVVVLDLTWILDRVLEHKREKLVIEEFNMANEVGEKVEVGPLDFQKQKYFQELTESIEENVSNKNINLKTVDNVLDQAILTTELERPKFEIVGNFDKAISFARDYGTSEQFFTAIYQKAWTSFFWLEDFDVFLGLYPEVEKLALKSNNIFQTERLRNLWSLLFPLLHNYKLITKAVLKTRTNTLKTKLNQFKNSKSFISASVHAKEMLLLMDLMLNMDDQKKHSEIFRKLMRVIDEVNTLIGFPFDPTFRALNELQDIFTGNKEYENLQEKIIEVTTQRSGDIAAAEMLYGRGLCYYESGDFYQAIVFLGKALYRFYKKESKNNLVRTLFLLSMAYEDAGLLWAARGALINAAAHATSEFWMYSKVNEAQVLCYERLRTIELRLGNIGYSLEWHQLNHMMSLQLAKTEEDKNKILNKDLYFGSILGLLIIKTPDEELKNLEYLPDILFSFDLDFAAYGLIFRLGCIELLPKEFVKDQTHEQLKKFFDSYITQPAQKALPDVPVFYNAKTIQMRSKILGSEFIVEVDNASPEIELGEYFLAALESFLSTSIKIAVSRESQIYINIKRDDKQDKRLSYELREGSKLGINITSKKFNPHKLSLKDEHEISSFFSEAVLQLIAHSVVFKDTKADLLKLFKDEEVHHRAFGFSGPLVSLGNVLGYKPKRDIRKWLLNKNKKYPYDKSKSGTPKKTSVVKTKKKTNFSDWQQVKHSDIKNVSIIKDHLWNQAGWKGVMYFVPPDRPPILALMFENKSLSEEIFKDWQERFSREDKDEVIRLAMLRGISRKNPSWYRAVIGINFESRKLKTDRLITTSRVHTMNPESTKNLDGFVESYRKFGIYLLAPAHTDPSKEFPDINVKLGIVKRKFEDRNVWELGLNDPDIAGVTEEDDIIIPEGVTNAPVLELLKWKSRKNNVK